MNGLRFIVYLRQKLKGVNKDCFRIIEGVCDVIGYVGTDSKLEKFVSL